MVKVCFLPSFCISLFYQGCYNHSLQQIYQRSRLWVNQSYQHRVSVSVSDCVRVWLIHSVNRSLTVTEWQWRECDRDSDSDWLTDWVWLSVSQLSASHQSHGHTHSHWWLIDDWLKDNWLGLTHLRVSQFNLNLAWIYFLELELDYYWLNQKTKKLGWPTNSHITYSTPLTEWLTSDWDWSSDYPTLLSVWVNR